MVAELPMESRTKAHIRGGDEYLGWTQDRYIAVATFNVLQQLLYVEAQSKSKAKLKKPQPIPIPDAPKRQQSDGNGFESMLERAKQKRAQKQGE